MIGLLCGFLGFGIHTLLSVHQARLKIGDEYGIIEYWKQFKYAMTMTAVVLIATYWVGIYHVSHFAEPYMPISIAEYLHTLENYRIVWVAWGMAIPKVMKWAEQWAAKK